MTHARTDRPNNKGTAFHHPTHKHGFNKTQQKVNHHYPNYNHDMINQNNTFRCIGSPLNYCFPYYFPRSFAFHLQKSPNLFNKAATSYTKSKKTANSFDSAPLVSFNRAGDRLPSVLIDILYSQQREGEVSFEFDPVSGKLSFLTFIDIGSLYNDKQLFAYQMAE